MKKSETANTDACECICFCRFALGGCFNYQLKNHLSKMSDLAESVHAELASSV